MRPRERIHTSREDAPTCRLVKQVRRHHHVSLTFLNHPDVPFENKAVARAIHPAVILRKNTYGNRNERAADCQAVLTSTCSSLSAAPAQSPCYHRQRDGHRPDDPSTPAVTSKSSAFGGRVAYFVPSSIVLASA